jgi:hypothetical protein
MSRSRAHHSHQRQHPYYSTYRSSRRADPPSRHNPLRAYDYAPTAAYSTELDTYGVQMADATEHDGGRTADYRDAEDSYRSEYSYREQRGGPSYAYSGDARDRDHTQYDQGPRARQTDGQYESYATRRPSPPRYYGRDERPPLPRRSPSLEREYGTAAVARARPPADASGPSSPPRPRTPTLPPSVGALSGFRSPRRSPTPAPPPEPTAEYLATAHAPPTPLADPSTRRKLLVLDLNGSLLLRAAHKVAPRSQPPGEPRLRSVHPRPYMPAFREYLFHVETAKWLDAMVWSSAQPHSVRSMVDACFGDAQTRLAAVWARDTLGLSDADYRK